MMLLLTACGVGASQTDTQPYDAEFEVEQDGFEVEDPKVKEVSPLEGKWTDDYEIMVLVVEGNKAVLNDMMIGNVNGMNIDFPNDYKKTEAEIIDGNLYLTVTPFDWVLEQAGVPADQTITTKLSKVGDTEESEEE